MIGFFVVEKLQDKDASGSAFTALVHSNMNESIKGVLFLPPFLRPNQCDIGEKSVVFGFLDETTGKGVAQFGQNDSDFQYFMNAAYEIDGKLTVKNEIHASDVISSETDVKANNISLKSHTHKILAAKFTGTIDPITGTVTGTISGNTESPAEA